MQKAKRQFKGTSKPKQHFDRKVRKVGWTIYVALGKLIPHDWDYVRLTQLNKTPNSVEILVEKLYSGGNHAQDKADNTAGKQDS